MIGASFQITLPHSISSGYVYVCNADSGRLYVMSMTKLAYIHLCPTSARSGVVLASWFLPSCRLRRQVLSYGEVLRTPVESSLCSNNKERLYSLYTLT